ncbi:unnamed protein product, partial [Allacma fusca]
IAERSGGGGPEAPGGYPFFALLREQEPEQEPEGKAQNPPSFTTGGGAGGQEPPGGYPFLGLAPGAGAGAREEKPIVQKVVVETKIAEPSSGPIRAVMVVATVPPVKGPTCYRFQGSGIWRSIVLPMVKISLNAVNVASMVMKRQSVRELKKELKKGNHHFQVYTKYAELFHCDVIFKMFICLVPVIFYN